MLNLILLIVLLNIFSICFSFNMYRRLVQKIDDKSFDIYYEVRRTKIKANLNMEEIREIENRIRNDIRSIKAEENKDSKESKEENPEEDEEESEI